MDFNMDNLDSSFVEPTHPLLIDTVFFNISKYLSYPVLVKCTEVCKQWLIIIEYILLERQMICVQGSTGQNLDKICPPINEVYSISDIAIYDVNFDQAPEIYDFLDHTKARHLSRLIITHSALSCKAFHTLFHTCGHKLEELEVNVAGSIITGLEQPPGYFPFPIPSATTTKASCNNNNNPFVINNYQDIMEIEIFPNLKRLRFISFGNVICNIHALCSNLPNLIELEIYGIIIPFRTSPTKFLNLPYLKKLSIALPGFWTSWNDLIFYFMNMNLKLIDFELLYVHKHINMKNLQMFLETQEDTLEIFNMTTSSKPTDADYNEIELMQELELPRLLKLKELSLDGFFIQNFANILKQIPNVEILKFYIVSEEKWIKIIGEIENLLRNPMSTVKKLYLTNEIGVNEFNILTKLFPTLEEVYLDYCNDELLQIIFSTLDGLKGLRVNSKHGEMTDSGLLGITIEESVKLRKEDKKVLDLVQNNNSLSLNICTMKRLEKLIIVCSDQLSITELTFLYGVCKLPSLRILVLIGINMTSDMSIVFNSKGFNLQDITKEFPLRNIRVYTIVKEHHKWNRHDLFYEIAPVIYDLHRN